VKYSEYSEGCTWQKITRIEPVEEVNVVAIKTASGTYQTRFGLSHNCDDL